MLTNLIFFFKKFSNIIPAVVANNIVEVTGVFTSPQTIGTLETIQVDGIIQSITTTGVLK